MLKHKTIESLQEIADLLFLSAGPALGGAIALSWLAGIGLGLFALLTR